LICAAKNEGEANTLDRWNALKIGWMIDVTFFLQGTCDTHDVVTKQGTKTNLFTTNVT